MKAQAKHASKDESGAPQVLLTRPLGEADHLLRLLRGDGWSCRNIPLFALRDLPASAVLQADLRQAERADALVFASPNAVRACFRLRPEFAPTGQLFAQGPATARALRQRGLPCSTPSAGFTTEDLLAHPYFSDIHGRRILRVSGTNGRELLLASLRDRGAQARVLALYARVPVPWTSRHLRCLTASVDALWVVSSKDSVIELRQRLMQPTLQHALHWPLLVSSHRLAEIAHDLGFTRLHTAASAASADLRAGLQALKDRSQSR